MKKLLTFILFAILLAPARWGIAINTQTQQCAGYWGGDEYGGYALPDGWRDYYPDSQDTIQTEIGSCRWQGENFSARAENCCTQLGYPFVAENIGKPTFSSMPLFFGFYACAGLFVLLTVCACVTAVIILVLYFLRKRSTRP